MMIYIKLFIEFLYVGLFSLGGGYATIPLIQDRIINVNGWITSTEFIDMITISQMTPGPLTVNISTFVGLNIGGVFGSIAATMGAALIGVTLTLVIYNSFKASKTKEKWNLFLKSLRISSTALIMLATLSIFELLLIPNGHISAIIIIPFLLILAASIKFKLDTMKILLISGIIGGLVL